MYPGPFRKAYRALPFYPGDRTRFAGSPGFPTSPQLGEGAELLVSEDGGATWEWRRLAGGRNRPTEKAAGVNRIVTTGRTLWACSRQGLYRSYDYGRNWRHIDRRNQLSATEVFDLVDTGKRLWIATNEGVFVSEDNGESWTQDRKALCPIRHLVQDDRVLWMGSRGGLLRRSRGGVWRSYSNTAQFVGFATTRESNRDILWGGTTGGLGVSRNGGERWRFFSVVDGLPSNRILCVRGQGDRIWAGTDGGIWTATELGESGRRYDRRFGLHGLHVRDIAFNGQTVWAATNHGISVLASRSGDWRTMTPVLDWQAVCVAEGEVFGAIIEDGGRMAVVKLNSEAETIQRMALPGYRGETVHSVLSAGGNVWAATDCGLYRSRDLGETWTRFAEETFWGARVTRIVSGPENMLCAHVAPSDPPSFSSLIFTTRDYGRSWQRLPLASPRYAEGLAMTDAWMLAGTDGGLYRYSGYMDDLRPSRVGWAPWYRMAALAASTYREDSLGAVSALDPYAPHGPTIWLGSEGSGAVERGVQPLEDLRRAWDSTGRQPLNVSRVSELGGANVLAVAASPGGVWFGTSSGAVYYDRISEWRSIQPAADGLCAAPVRAPRHRR